MSRKHTNTTHNGRRQNHSEILRTKQPENSWKHVVIGLKGQTGKLGIPKKVIAAKNLFTSQTLSLSRFPAFRLLLNLCLGTNPADRSPAG